MSFFTAIALSSLLSIAATSTTTEGCVPTGTTMEQLDAARDLHRAGAHRAAITAFECALPRAEATSRGAVSGGGISLSHRMTYARSLKKAGEFKRALLELDRVGEIVARDSALATRVELRAALLTAQASVHACAADLPAAVEVGQRSLATVVALFREDVKKPPKLLEAIVRRMLDLAKWHKWQGSEWESDKMLRSAARLITRGSTAQHRWTMRSDSADSLQYPGVELVSRLPRRAWTWRYPAAAAAGPLAPPVLGAASLAAMEAAAMVLVAAAPQLRAEYLRLDREGWLQRQAECIDDPAMGSWRFLNMFASGAERAAPKRRMCGGGDDDDAPHAAAACGVVRALEALLGTGSLVRVGYSALAAGGHIRPHCGATNAHLKLHVGLVVPHGCTTLRVGHTVLMPGWREGEVTGLDDSFEHEVWNNCTEERAILQVVVKHPHLDDNSEKLA